MGEILPEFVENELNGRPEGRCPAFRRKHDPIGNLIDDQIQQFMTRLSPLRANFLFVQGTVTRVFVLRGTNETTRRGYRVSLIIATAFVLVLSVASSSIAVGAAGAGFTQTTSASLSQTEQLTSTTPDSSLRQQSTDSISRIAFEYSYFGGNVNLEINDQRRFDTTLAALDGTTVGGATVEVPRQADYSQSEGLVIITGDIDSFSVGGQEFTIDNVTFGQPDDPSATVEFDSLSPTQSSYAVGDNFTASPSEVKMSIEPYTFGDGGIYRDGSGYRRDGDDPVFAPGNVNLRFNISSIPTESEDTVTIVSYDVQTGTTTDRTITRTDKTFSFDDATLPADEDVPFPTVEDGYQKRNVTETNQYPWSAVGQVVGNVSEGPGVNVCSGTVIENNHVLTAAHCVYDTTTGEWLSSRGTDQDSPSLQDTPPLFNESVNITQIQTYKKYTKNGDQTGNLTYDIAVLTLEENVESRTGTFGYAARLPENSRFDRSAHVTGYPDPGSAGYVNGFNERWDLIAEGDGIGVSPPDDCDASKSARCHVFRTGDASESLVVGGYSGGPVWENGITGPDILSVLSSGAYNGWRSRIPGVVGHTVGIRISQDTYSDISKMAEHGNDIAQPPIAIANGPYSVEKGDSVTLVTNSSNDPDSSITGATWTVTSGPGSISGETYQAPANVSSDTQATVKLTITGNNSRTDTATATININNPTDDADARDGLPVEIDTGASSLQPSRASTGATQNYSVSLTVVNISAAEDQESSGEVDLQFEDFQFSSDDEESETPNDDLTIHYTSADIVNRTLTVSTTVSATAPDSAGTRDVFVTDLRRENTRTDSVKYLIEDAHIEIDTIDVESTNQDEDPEDGASRVSVSADGDTTISPGNETSVTVTLSNTGNLDADAGGLNVSVPGELSVSTVNGDGTNRPDRFFIDPIPAGESVNVTYTFIAESDAPLGTATVNMTGTLETENGTQSTSIVAPVDIAEPGGLPTDRGEPSFGDVLGVIQAFHSNSEYADTNVIPRFGDVLEVIQAFNAG